MRDASNLFSKGYLTRQPSLSDVLDAHKRSFINKIKSITDLNEMTDSFCERTIKDALVEPLVLHFDRMTRQTRTEEFDGSQFPGDFNVQRGRRYSKTVVRILIPFSGDRTLIEYTPNQAVMNFPRGEVYGNTIQFDILMWGYQDDASRVRQEVESNRALLEIYATNVSKQVKEFNVALAPQIKVAFAAKLDELTRQHAVFDDLGIPEEPQPQATPMIPATPKSKKGNPRPDQFIVNIEKIEKMIVQTLNQTNNNLGDVNNAIQAAD